jgi:Tol biopolymer transport system component
MGRVKRWLTVLVALPLLVVGSVGATTDPTAAPRNGLVALQGQGGLHIVDPATGSARLVPQTMETSDAAWSPDGKLLAVTDWNADVFRVYTMRPDGSERQLVLENASSPSWSPDGTKLVVVREDYTRDDPSMTLAVVNSDGSEARELAPDVDFVSQPEWSPDGKLIAYLDGAGRVRLISPAGTAVAAPRAVTTTAGLSWSPDSTRLAFDRFVETKGTTRQVVVVLDLATGTERVFRGRQDSASSPAWSPDGKLLAFLSMRIDPAASTAGCGGEQMPSRLWAMAADGSNPHRLLKAPDFYFGTPVWAKATTEPPAERSAPR